jgi:hypothetical protein
MKGKLIKAFRAAAIIAAGLVLAANIFALGGGTSNADFLKIGVGARPSAMGEAYVAVADDSDAAFWNPAGLTAVDKISVTGMHLVWYDNTYYEYFAGVMPVDSMTDLGVCLNYLWMPGFNSTGNAAGVYLMPATQQSYDMAITFSYAKDLGNLYTKDFTIGNISLGGNATYIARSIIGVQMPGTFDIDLGLMANITEELKFGLVFQNIGTAAGEDQSPFDIRTGISYKYKQGNDFYVLVDGDLLKPVDVTNVNFNEVLFNLGMEMNIANIFLVRGGYMFGDPDYTFTVGGGFDIGGYANLDYAYMPNKELGGTHRVSLAGKFGQSVPRPVIGGPQPPQKVTASSGDRIVLVGWEPNPEANIIGYNIYSRSSKNEAFKKLNDKPIMEETKYSANLTNGQTYYFVVTAINNRNLESIYSEEIAATPQKYVAKKPAKPTGVTARVDKQTIIITWDSTTDPAITGYNLYYKKNNDIKFKKLNRELLKENKATLAGLNASVIYYFMVTTVNKDGIESDFSEVVSGKVESTNSEYY